MFKQTKKALMLSVFMLIICLGMLLGTTYAWFTDSVSSGSNVIQAGSLDIVLEYWDGNQWVDAEGKVLEFQKADTTFGTEVIWEPGCTYKMPKFRVRNEGNLAAKILIKLNGVKGDEKLLEVIKLTTTITNIPESLLTGSSGSIFSRFNNATVDIMYGTPDGTIVFDHSLMGKGIISPNTGHTDTSPEFTISGHMDENAGNEYQGLKIEGISISVVAAQSVYEYDSFGREYDKTTAYPFVSGPVNVPNETAKEPLTLFANGMKVEVPVGLVNNFSDDVKSVAISFAKPIVINNSIHYAYVELIDQNGNIIDLSNNSELLTITISGQTTFVPGTSVDVFHDEERVTTATVAADGSISYTATHFCEINVTLLKDAYYVNNKDDFAYEVALGGRVVPNADMVLDNYIFTAGKAEIFLNGKNIASNIDQIFGACGATADLSINGEGLVSTKSGYVGYVYDGGKLSINGGTFQLGETNNAGHFYTQNSGKTIINGGTFISEDKNTPIVYCINGFVEINGGFFQNKANPSAALISMGNNINYVKNQKITISGGTFVNWNPMDSAFAKAWEEPNVPALIVLADGYKMISEIQSNGDVWYMVVPE